MADIFLTGSYIKESNCRGRDWILYMEPILDIPARLERRRKALTVAELAEELNLSGKTIYEQVSKGHIPYYKIAGSIRFDPVRIAGWLRLQEAA